MIRVPCDRRDPETETIVRENKVADVVSAILRTHRRQYLPAIADDIDDAFRVLQAADDGWHWPFAWWRLRVVRVLARIAGDSPRYR